MFRNPAVRLASAVTATVAVLAAGPALSQAMGGPAPEPMPAAWEDGRQHDLEQAAASHQGVLEAEEERKRAEKKAKREAARKKREAARKKREAEERRAAEQRAAEEKRASRARASAGGSPAQNRALGMQMCADRGWSASQCEDLGRLWQKESGWSHKAHNGSSGAHGIPQALPGSKMSSHGSDWASNPRTQIAWGLDYIAGRYGNPSNAWAHSQSRGWY